MNSWGPFLQNRGNLSGPKAIFSSSVSKNVEVYTPETSCMKGTSVHIKNMWIQQLCDCKVRDFALQARKVSGISRDGPQVSVSEAKDYFERSSHLKKKLQFCGISGLFRYWEFL